MVLKLVAIGLLLFSNHADAATLQKEADLGISNPTHVMKFATNDLLVGHNWGATTSGFRVFDAHNGAAISDIQASNIPLSFRDGLQRPAPEFITSSLPDAKRTQTELLATGTWPMKIISVWNMRTGQALWHYKFPYGHDFRMVRLSNDGKTVVACASLTSAAFETFRCSLVNENGIFKDLELSPEAATPELKLQARLIRGHLSSSPVFSVDGTRFVLVRSLGSPSVDAGEEAIFFDSASGEALQRRQFTDIFVTFSDDLKLIAATIDYKQSQTVDVQETETGKVLSRASMRLESNRGFRPGTYTIFFSDEQARIGRSRGQEKHFHFFDALTGQIRETVAKLGSVPLDGQQWFGQKELDVFFAYDVAAKTTYVFDQIGKGEKLQAIPGYTSAMGIVPASPDGKAVVLKTARGDYSLWSWK